VLSYSLASTNLIKRSQSVGPKTYPRSNFSENCGPFVQRNFAASFKQCNRGTESSDSRSNYDCSCSMRHVELRFKGATFRRRTIDSPPTSAGVKIIPMNLGYSNRMFNSTQGHDTATKRCSRFCAGTASRLPSSDRSTRAIEYSSMGQFPDWVIACFGLFSPPPRFKTSRT